MHAVLNQGMGSSNGLSSSSSNLNKNFTYSSSRKLSLSPFSYLHDQISSPNNSDNAASFISSSSSSKAIINKNHHHHQRCSSENFLIEDQFSWLEELLNEPDNNNNTVVNHHSRGVHHRRAASDTYAAYNNNNNNNNNNLGAATHDQSFAIKEVSKCADIDHKYEIEASWEKNNSVIQAKSPPSKNASKRAKQQSAHRSRVRKLKYIAELERTVQLLQAEGSEIQAELEFINQQNLILSMENRALKQRLDGLSQEQLIKHCEQEMLERELARLQTLCQLQTQQQMQMQPQLQHSKHHRTTKSRDLEPQFANLSLKNKETSSNRCSATSSIRI